jgi:copper chaperone CopZ
MKETILIIENLKCHGCANTIKTSLSKIEAVFQVQVDNETNQVTVQHDDSLSKDILAEKLSMLGYPEQGESTLLHKAKSYISCAVGRLTPTED